MRRQKTSGGLFAFTGEECNMDEQHTNHAAVENLLRPLSEEIALKKAVSPRDPHRCNEFGGAELRYTEEGKIRL